jgi:hypothetical protein
MLVMGGRMKKEERRKKKEKGVGNRESGVGFSRSRS